MIISQSQLEKVVTRAALAPSAHNVQPTKWQLNGADLTLYCDTNLSLKIGDPSGRDAALSCGAALEATVLALSEMGIGSDVTEAWDEDPSAVLRPVARLGLSEGQGADPLNSNLENRFTWRGLFASQTPDLFGWSRADTVLVLDQPGRHWLAERNDWASYEIMQDKGFRRELLHWMRLSERHPRYKYDGLGRQAMGLTGAEARVAGLALGVFWPLLKAFGQTRKITQEAQASRSAPIIALFHRPAQESPITSGRAYLRLCLEAAHLGFAGWPMAALSDHEITQAEICDRYAIGPDQRLIQAIRFGAPTGETPPRARRPLSELIL